MPGTSTQTEAGPAPSRLRAWTARLLLLAVTLGLSLLLLEWGVRLACPYFRPNAQIPFHATTNGFALGTPLATARQATPKGDYDLVIRFNEDGFRDSKNLREGRPEDWYAVGDSYTLGWGVQEGERFSNQVEQQFKSSGLSNRVFNIAIPDNLIGYQRMLKYAESRGAKIHHVIIGVCMENDLRDYRDGKSSWDAEAAPADQAASRKESARAWIKNHSALYNACSFAMQRVPLLRGMLERAGVARSIDELSGRNEWSEVVLNTSRDELVKLAAGRDAVVVIIPSRRLWQGDNQQTEKRVHEAFVRLAREAGLKVLDLKGAFEEGGNPLSFYFKTDPHWNARGHAVAGRELFKLIQASARQ